MEEFGRILLGGLVTITAVLLIILFLPSKEDFNRWFDRVIRERSRKGRIREEVKDRSKKTFIAPSEVVTRKTGEESSNFYFNEDRGKRGGYSKRRGSRKRRG